MSEKPLHRPLSHFIQIREESEFRAIIKYFYLEEWTTEKIKLDLAEGHEGSASTLKTLYLGTYELKRGRDALKPKRAPDAQLGPLRRM